jgi:hypothetical protein
LRKRFIYQGNKCRMSAEAGGFLHGSERRHSVGCRSRDILSRAVLNEIRCRTECPPTNGAQNARAPAPWALQAKSIVQKSAMALRRAEAG